MRAHTWAAIKPKPHSKNYTSNYIPFTKYDNPILLYPNVLRARDSSARADLPPARVHFEAFET